MEKKHREEGWVSSSCRVEGHGGRLFRASLLAGAEEKASEASAKHAGVRVGVCGPHFLPGQVFRFALERATALFSCNGIFTSSVIFRYAFPAKSTVSGYVRIEI